MLFVCCLIWSLSLKETWNCRVLLMWSNMENKTLFWFFKLINICCFIKQILILKLMFCILVDLQWTHCWCRNVRSTFRKQSQMLDVFVLRDLNLFKFVTDQGQAFNSYITQEAKFIQCSMTAIPPEGHKIRCMR